MANKYRNNLILSNCSLLQDLNVLLPSELLYLREQIEEVFVNIEQFYKKFLSIKDFTSNLSVIFHLKGRMTKSGDFDCCAARTNKPVINIYDTVEKICFNGLDNVLAHEFAHFIAWRLNTLIGYNGGDISEKKGTKENELALKFLSFQEIKPTGIPYSSSDLNSPAELYARYMEQYYIYCFKKSEESENTKNCMYVRKSDFETGLLSEVRNYLNYFQDKQNKKETKIINGNLYSKDEKCLLKYLSNEEDCCIPESVEIISTQAFSRCTSLKHIYGGHNVRFIQSGAFSFCTELENIDELQNIEIIGSLAFAKCKSLKICTGFNNIKYIGSNAFIRCSQIKPDLFINNVSYIEKNAFSMCSEN
ncbi:MAG: leucine-rich repeat domain-containing protein [Treponema sp.]|nr:leucine-rich repeat domain-containing protein [Treponema sp.]